MNKYNKLGNLFSQLYKEEYIKIDEPLKNYVNFKVGGPADILLIPETKSQVIESVKICRENNIPVYVIGNGSNLLVKDGIVTNSPLHSKVPRRRMGTTGLSLNIT